jgi:hypothetical protein
MSEENDAGDLCAASRQRSEFFGVIFFGVRDSEVALIDAGDTCDFLPQVSELKSS